MTSLRDHLAAVEAAGGLLRVDEQVHWAVEAATVGREAASNNGPAVLMRKTAGFVGLVSGLYTGPDLMQRRAHTPWSRIALGIGFDDAGPRSYADLLDTIAPARDPLDAPVDDDSLATPRGLDLYSLGLPKRTVNGRPTLTLGILAATVDDTTVWMPVRGTVRGTDQLRVSVPEPAAARLDEGADVTVALGLPAAAQLATLLQWAGKSGMYDSVAQANAIDEVPVTPAAGGFVPTSAEVLLDGVAYPTDSVPEGLPEAWELTTEVAALDIDVVGTAARDDPVVPLAPLGASMADDTTLVSLVESARLYHRVNNYWGVAPVEWVSLPPETRLGICLVASEILYAGFEWQLANTLFSFSKLFDKVLILDPNVPPGDLARAFDDMWVKAHPSQDWVFSESNAPSATAPAYSRDRDTGSRLYVNAAWDPEWDEAFLAPRVSFVDSYPSDLRDSVRERWRAFGFDRDPSV